MGETSVLGELLVRLGLDAKAFDEAMGKVGGKVKSLEQNMASLGAGLTKGVTLPLVAMGTAALKTSLDFNAAMANIGTLIPGNTQRVEELKTAVQDMAVEFGKSTSDLADGAYQIVSALGDTADTLSYLETATKAAAAGMATVTDSVNLMSAVMKGYGDVSAEAAEKAMDLAFETVKLGQTTFPELAASMQRVIPIAATLGVTQEELFGSMATLTGVTGGTAEVATQLTAILSAMMKPTTEMAAAIRGLGYSSTEAMLAALGFQGALEALIGTTDGTSQAVAKLFGEKEALNAAFALTGAQAEIYAEKLAQVKNATGALDTAFSEITDGANALGFSLSQLKQRVVVTFQRLGDALSPLLIRLLDALEPLLGAVERLASAFQSASPGVQTFAAAVLGAAAAIGPLLFATSKLVGALTTVKAAAVAAKGAMATMSLSSAASAAGVSTLSAAAASLGAIGLVVGGIIAGAVALDKLIAKGVETGIIDGYQRSIEQIQREAPGDLETILGNTELHVPIDMAIDYEELDYQVQEAIIAKTGGKFKFGIKAGLIVEDDPDLGLGDVIHGYVEALIEGAMTKIDEMKSSLEQEAVELEVKLNDEALSTQIGEMVRELQTQVSDLSFAFGETLASETASMGETLTSSIRSELSSLLDKSKTGLTKDEKARLAELQEMEKAFDIKTSGGLGNLTNILSTSLRPENLAALGLGEDVIEAIQGEPLKTAIDQLQTEQKIAQLAYAQAGQLAQQYNLTAEQKASLESYLATVYGQAVGFEASVLSAVADVSLAIRELDLSVTVNVDPWEGTYSTDGSVPLASPTGSAQAAGGASSALGPQKDVTVANPEEASLLEAQNMLLEDIKAELQKTYSPANPSNDNLIWRLALI